MTEDGRRATIDNPEVLPLTVGTSVGARALPVRAIIARSWLLLGALSCSFPGYTVSSDAETSNGGLAGGGTESVAGMATQAIAGSGMGGAGAASGAAAGGTVSEGGARPEPLPAGGGGGVAAAAGMAGASNQTGGTMAAAGAGGAETSNTCADLDDLPSECLCRDHSGHAYLFCSTTHPWSQGRARCGFYQMSLAKIESPGEDSWILKQAHDISDPRPLTFFWIGASSVDSPGTWHWPDGAAFWRGDANGSQVSGSYFNWRISNPQDTKGPACVFMDDNGWEEGDCSIKRGYVCEAQ
jgi:hypothetical protein